MTHYALFQNKDSRRFAGRCWLENGLEDLGSVVWGTFFYYCQCDGYRCLRESGGAGNLVGHVWRVRKSPERSEKQRAAAPDEMERVQPSSQNQLRPFDVCPASFIVRLSWNKFISHWNWLRLCLRATCPLLPNCLAPVWIMRRLYRVAVYDGLYWGNCGGFWMLFLRLSDAERLMQQLYISELL